MYEEEEIAKWVSKGCFSGYYPHWKLLINDVDKENLSETTLKHITNAIENGCIEGEIIEDDFNSDNNGWWILQIQ